ncbi:MAG: hypothetical protein N3F04_01220 [Candidatus Nezhaarchaeota archaeon]|nr:hypothetical protein [Candidatus Nezhaarchaeota archaeon]MCX8141398.1 hypothetical protein [Candidatus Nezhaarchaeota archaeon]MDW8049664.1 hypothetical protein [Nitrososphaerota archaeon]
MSSVSRKVEQDIKVELDLDRDILYIKVRGCVAKGLIRMTEDLYLEVDEHGNIVGIQLRSAKKHIVEGIAHRIKKLIEEGGKSEGEGKEV